MVIRQIKIQSFGALNGFAYNFANGLNIVKARYIREVFYAIQLLCNHRASCLPACWSSGSTKIEALVQISKNEYRVLVKADPNQKRLHMRAYDKEGNDKTSEYSYLTSHCAEQDLSEAFCADAENALFRLIQYLDKDCFDTLQEHSNGTDRIFATKAFRAYLKAFVKKFEPETIRDGKRYELTISPNGRYAVQYKGADDTPVLLSESEQTLFRYRCFLKTAEFWQEFEELRNLHGVTKPILITDFLERLDESIDMQDILERTKRLNRQVIMLTI